MRIGIFGGSFDPPHEGHLNLIKQVMLSKVVDEIWLMPTFISPWKNEAASAEDRSAMCELLTKDLPLGWQVKVSDLEIKRRGKSYTIDTVRGLKKKFNHQFYWLIGSDLVKDLPKWHKAEELYREIEFLVFPRTKISSTKIREKIKKGQPLNGLVPKNIEQYIKKHKPYV